MRSLILTASFLALTVSRVVAQSTPDEFFETRIRPVLSTRCYACHSSKLAAPKGELALDTKTGLLKGGKLGPAIVPGNPSESRLLQALRYTDPHLQMPPSGKLADSIIADFEHWIAAGARDPRAKTVVARKKIHENLQERPNMDNSAALIRDLRQRGLLDETLVVWGGEFGRTPVSESGDGRDHNPYGFSMFMAGGGVKGGMTYGATDEFGFKAVENRVSIHELHATILHQLGIDHEKLTYRYAGRDFRLTDVFGNVVTDLLA